MIDNIVAQNGVSELSKEAIQRVVDSFEIKQYYIQDR
jgi:hypothetical protein